MNNKWYQARYVYPATAFPGPKEASGLPANIYAEKTNPVLSSAHLAHWLLDKLRILPDYYLL